MASALSMITVDQQWRGQPSIPWVETIGALHLNTPTIQEICCYIHKDIDYTSARCKSEKYLSVNIVQWKSTSENSCYNDACGTSHELQLNL